MNIKSPVVLFVYRRVEHTKNTLDSLKMNVGASETELFIFSDGSKNESDKAEIVTIRCLIREYNKFFKSVHIVEREKNIGLAENIIDGVIFVINKYEKAIIIEDDIVTSRFFLKFMNDALNKYKDNKNVWHITGWNYPIGPFIGDDMHDAFLWRTMNCWGWATWKDRWKHFEKNPPQLINSWDKKQIYEFNLNGSYDFWEQVKRNQSGSLNTWAIFWYCTIAQNNGLCLNPKQTLVRNIGNDGSGENCGRDSKYNGDFSPIEAFSLPDNIKENSIWLEEIIIFYKKIKQIRCCYSCLKLKDI